MGTRQAQVCWSLEGKNTSALRREARIQGITPRELLAEERARGHVQYGPGPWILDSSKGWFTLS
jgi:hypothetical protein